VAFVVILLLLVIPGVAAAGQQRCEPTDPGWVLDQFLIAEPQGTVGPPATDGSTVLWADDRAEAGADVYAYDLETKTESLIAGGVGDQSAPAIGDGLAAWTDWASGAPAGIALDLDGEAGPWPLAPTPAEQIDTDGELVVWADLSGGEANADVWARSAAGGEPFAVCTAEGPQLFPAVSDGVIVWQDGRNDTWDIYGYDTATNQEFVVVDRDGDQMKPDVFSGIVVWEHRSLSLLAAATRCEEQTDIRGRYLPQAVDGGGTDGGVPVSGKATLASRCENPDGFFVVCDAWGNQTDPSISGPLVAWEDDRCGETDIYGYDLMGEEEFVICAAEGAQADPSVGGDMVVWSDYRASEGGAIWGAAWAPGGDADDPAVTDEWTDETLIRLFLSALNELGLFTEVRFSFDGVEWTPWQALDDVEELTLPEGDGPKTVSLQFRDGDGNETPVISIGLVLDTRGPRTTAPVTTFGKAGETGLVKFKVSDRLSPRASVKVLIRNGRGRLAKTLYLGERRTGRLLGARFCCDLKPGAYTYIVRATDLAGNRQVRAGKDTLVVR
jgi:beta propeller repeat protein